MEELTERIKEIVQENGIRNAIVKLYGTITLDDVVDTLTTSIVYKKAILFGTKGDLPNSKKNYEILKTKTTLRIHPISIENEDSLVKLKEYLFSIIEVIRIYTKPPKRKPAKQPFVCPIGTTIGELAGKIHNDFLKNFRYARVWGSSVGFSGQHVGLEHELLDSDTVELIVKR